MNTFAEDSIGDSFTRTTKTTEKAQANNETKTTQPLNATGKNSTTTFGSTTNFATKAGSTANSFGMLSSKANNIDNENKNETKTEKNGFGSLSVSGGGSQYTVNNDNEIKELAEELGCDATEDAVKNELQGMSAQELVKLDGSLLDMAEDLNLISMKDVEEKTGVKEKDLASKNNNNKEGAKKIKFGTMTSGDMV